MIAVKDGRPTEISVQFKIPDELFVPQSEARAIGSFLVTVFE